MEWIKGTLYNTATIKVLVLPVAPMPEHIFQTHYKAISAPKRVQINTLPSFPKDAPFPLLSWQHASLNFQYEASRIDDCEEAINIDWDELKVTSKVMAVICVLHCPLVSDIRSAYRDFLALKEKLSYGVRGPRRFRCYAFCPGEKQADVLERDDLIIFPNQPDRLHFYLSTCLSDTSAALLNDFSERVISVRSVRQDKSFGSPLDGDEFRHSRRAQQRAPGRREKYIGDLCLLAGSPADALARYRSAATLTRAQGDMAWLGTTYEHEASALALLDLHKARTEPHKATQGDADQPELAWPEGALVDPQDAVPNARFNPEVAERLKEAVAAYRASSQTTFLCIGASLKLARYYVMAGMRMEVLRTLRLMFELRAPCSARNQIAITLESALLCQWLQCRRKSGMYLIQAAKLFMELHQPDRAYAMLRLTAPVFRIPDPLLESPLPSNRKHTQSKRGPVRRRTTQLTRLEEEDSENAYSLRFERALNSDTSTTPPASSAALDVTRAREWGAALSPWVTLQRKLLLDLIRSSRTLPDQAVTATWTTLLLRMLWPFIDRQYQKAVCVDLWGMTTSLPVDTPANLVGLPFLLRLIPATLPPAKTPMPGRLQKGNTEHQHNRLSDLATGKRRWAKIGQEVLVTAANDDLEYAARAKNEQKEGEKGREGEGQGDEPAKFEFLFNPLEEESATRGGEEQRQQRVFVAGDEVAVDVVLANPLQVDLLLQRICLSTEGVPFQAYPCSVYLPPLCQAHTVTLLGTPLQAGILTFRGCHIRAFNLNCEHRVDSCGRGLYDALLPGPSHLAEYLRAFSRLSMQPPGRPNSPLPASSPVTVASSASSLSSSINNVSLSRGDSLASSPSPSPPRPSTSSAHSSSAPSSPSTSLTNPAEAVGPAGTFPAGVAGQITPTRGKSASRSGPDYNNNATTGFPHNDSLHGVLAQHSWLDSHPAYPPCTTAAFTASSSSSLSLTSIGQESGSQSSLSLSSLSLAMTPATSSDTIVSLTQLAQASTSTLSSLVQSATQPSTQRTLSAGSATDLSDSRKSGASGDGEGGGLATDMSRRGRLASDPSRTGAAADGLEAAGARSETQLVGEEVEEDETRLPDALSAPLVECGKVEVVSALPLMQVELDFSDEPGEPNRRGLMLGETRTLHVTLQNLGTVPVAALQLCLAPLFHPNHIPSGQPAAAAGSEERADLSSREARNNTPRAYWQEEEDGEVWACMSAWSLTELQAHLPILPGSSARIAVRVRGRPHCIGATATCQYAASRLSDTRRTTHAQTRWALLGGLVLRALDVWPLPPKSVPPNASFPVPDRKPAVLLVLAIQNTLPVPCRLYVNLDGEPLPGPAAVAAGLCAQRLVMPLPHLSFGPENDRRLRLLSSLLDSDCPAQTEGEEEEPCLSPSELNELTKAMQQICVENLSSRLSLRWEGADGSRGVLFSLSGPWSPRSDLAGGATGPGGRIHSGQQLAAPTGLSASLTSSLAVPLMMPQMPNNPAGAPAPSGPELGSERGGGSAVDKEKDNNNPEPPPSCLAAPQLLSISSLVRLLPPALAFNVTVEAKDETGKSNGSGPVGQVDSAHPTHNHRYSLGHLLEMKFKVTNLTDRPVKAELAILPYQDGQDGTSMETDLSHRLMWVGSLSVPLPSLQPGDSAEHRLPVCFLSVGRFKFRVTALRLVLESVVPEPSLSASHLAWSRLESRPDLIALPQPLVIEAIS